jgi:hypothetical protein
MLWSGVPTAGLPENATTTTISPTNSATGSSSSSALAVFLAVGLGLLIGIIWLGRQTIHLLSSLVLEDVDLVYLIGDGFESDTIALGVELLQDYHARHVEDGGLNVFEARNVEQEEVKSKWYIKQSVEGPRDVEGYRGCAGLVTAVWAVNWMRVMPFTKPPRGPRDCETRCGTKPPVAKDW